MKLAIAFNRENDNVNLHFENTRCFDVYEIENGESIYSELVSTMGKENEELVEFLAFLEIDALICDQISDHIKQQILEEGILLYEGCNGNAEHIFDMFMEGVLLFDIEA